MVKINSMQSMQPSTLQKYSMWYVGLHKYQRTYDYFQKIIAEILTLDFALSSGLKKAHESMQKLIVDFSVSSKFTLVEKPS